MKRSWRCILPIAFLVISFPVIAATYSTDATFEPEIGILQGTTQVSFDAYGKDAYFLLLANLHQQKNPYASERELDDRYPWGFNPGSISIESVEVVDGEKSVPVDFSLASLPPALQDYSLQQTVLVVELPASSDQITLRIHFNTQCPELTSGDEGITDEILTWRLGWYPILIPENYQPVIYDSVLQMESSEYLPLEIPASAHEIEIQVPSDYEFVCGMDFVESVPSENELTTTYHAWSESPIRMPAITIGPDYESFSLASTNVPIVVYFRSGHEATARLFATYADDILAYYEKRFGDYSHERLVIVENPNTQGVSMAADGIVWLSEMFFTHRHVTLPGILNRLAEFTIAHEIAHQWWGVGIGVDLNAENWLSEGLAQYLSVDYFEDRYGAFDPNLFRPQAEGIVEDFIDSQFGFFNLREHWIELSYIVQSQRGFDEAVIKPLSEVQYENSSVVRLYDKGYLVARTIAAEIGEDTFERALREAKATYGEDILSVLQLRRILEEEAGRSLGTIFDTWLMNPGTVDYSVEIMSREETETGHRTQVMVSREGGTPQKVIVDVKLVSGDNIRQTWNGRFKKEVLIFDTEKKVRRVTIDPEHLLPDIDRLNNNSPIEAAVIAQGRLLPLDSYVITPDLLSQGMTINYLNRRRFGINKDGLWADVLEGRNHRFALAADIGGGQLTGNVGYTYTSFSPRNTGSPGTFWEPTLQSGIAVHRIPTGGEPFSYLHLGIVSDLVSRGEGATGLSVDLAGGPGGRLELAAFDEIRIFPHVYLQGVLSVGVGFGKVPAPLLFGLDELVSYGRMVDGSWVSTSYPGEKKLYGRLAMEFPIGNGQMYNLLNLLMIDRTRGKIFFGAGSSWTDMEEFGRTKPKLEVGIEGILDLSAIGGLLPAQFRAGYAFPILEGKKGVFYFDLSL